MEGERRGEGGYAEGGGKGEREGGRQEGRVE